MKNIFLRYEKYLFTRWKIFLRYTMKNFLYNENIFLHDKLFCKLHYRKLDQKYQNTSSTRCNFLRNEKFFHAIKIWFLHDQNIFLGAKYFFYTVKESLCKIKSFLNDEKTVSHDKMFSIRWKKNFYTMRNFFFPINIFLHHEDYFFQTMKNISFIRWKYFLHEEK